MSDLSESAARRSETNLVRGRLSGLSQEGHLNPDQRIGVCMALKILDARCEELELRRKDTP